MTVNCFYALSWNSSIYATVKKVREHGLDFDLKEGFDLDYTMDKKSK